MFKIEDESHAEPQKGEFDSFEAAMNELKSRAQLPWDEAPNRCPCTSWKTCGRNYQIIEYDDSTIPWKELDRHDVLTVSAQGVIWSNT